MRTSEIRHVVAGAVLGGVVAFGTPPAEQVMGDTTAATPPATDRDDDAPDLGWIGLLGLAGLAGLRRRDPAVVHGETVHTERRR